MQCDYLLYSPDLPLQSALLQLDRQALQMMKEPELTKLARHRRIQKSRRLFIDHGCRQNGTLMPCLFTSCLQRSPSKNVLSPRPKAEGIRICSGCLPNLGSDTPVSKLWQDRSSTYPSATPLIVPPHTAFRSGSAVGRHCPPPCVIVLNCPGGRQSTTLVESSGPT